MLWQVAVHAAFYGAERVILSGSASPQLTRSALLRAAMAPDGEERAYLAVAPLDSAPTDEEMMSPDFCSSQHIDRFEDGEPKQLRFTYVDEHSCIGCKNCAMVARSTFFMEDDHGRARVFNQGGDDAETIQEAVETCPVDCIHYVSLSDLQILEEERIGQTIDFKKALVGLSVAPPTRATSLDSGKVSYPFPPDVTSHSPYISLEFSLCSLDSGTMRCTNCPTRGCKECPMYGVGQNPEYLQRQRENEQRRKESGEAKAALEQKRREEAIAALNDAPPLYDDEERLGEPPEAWSQSMSAVAKALGEKALDEVPADEMRFGEPPRAQTAPGAAGVQVEAPATGDSGRGSAPAAGTVERVLPSSAEQTTRSGVAAPPIEGFPYDDEARFGEPDSEGQGGAGGPSEEQLDKVFKALYAEGEYPNFIQYDDEERFGDEPP